MRISDWSSDVCSSDLATFSVGAGATVPFILAWRPSHRPVERSIDPQRRLQETESWWLGWSGRCQFGGGGPDHWRDAVTRSLITLKALTFAPTGGIVAAAPTSLPAIGVSGGSRMFSAQIGQASCRERVCQYV